jgi:hypothetical protein
MEMTIVHHESQLGKKKRKDKETEMALPRAGHDKLSINVIKIVSNLGRL